jgi:hypothetical protein
MSVSLDGYHADPKQADADTSDLEFRAHQARGSGLTILASHPDASERL